MSFWANVSFRFHHRKILHVTLLTEWVVAAASGGKIRRKQSVSSLLPKARLIVDDVVVRGGQRGCGHRVGWAPDWQNDPKLWKCFDACFGLTTYFLLINFFLF